MAQFTVNASQQAPYENFKFRVKWDGKYVAGVSKVGALSRNTDAVTHREGGAASSHRVSPGQSTYEAITLERGVTHDLEFESWASNAWDFAGGPSAESTLAEFRKDIIIEVYDEEGQKALAYTVYRCWVSDFTSMPELDAKDNAVAILSMTLQNEGWERDSDVTEPTEPS